MKQDLLNHEALDTQQEVKSSNNIKMNLLLSAGILTIAGLLFSSQELSEPHKVSIDYNVLQNLKENDYCSYEPLYISDYETIVNIFCNCFLCQSRGNEKVPVARLKIDTKANLLVISGNKFFNTRGQKFEDLTLTHIDIPDQALETNILSLIPDLVKKTGVNATFLTNLILKEIALVKKWKIIPTK